MAVNSRFIQVHSDAIIEWIFDDSFNYEDEYSIIKDVKNGTTSFTFNETVNDLNNYNKLPNQLYLVDSLINRFGIVTPDTKPFLQESKFVNNQPSLFNKVKIWFPIHFNFNNNTGLYFNTYGLNYENSVAYNFSNFFLDTSVQGDLNKIQNESKPFRMNEKLWGKSITLYVPSLYSESRNRTNGSPTVGSINYNLTNGNLGLSQTSLIYIDFRFLVSKQTILNETTYITSPPLVTSITQAPEYNNLAVQIEEATDGDYFKINGLYNSTVGDFDKFMNTLAESGKASYILYSITIYEENIPKDTRDIYVYQDFFKGIDDFRPVLKHTNTTASIKVDMKLINAVDSSVITKSAEFTMVGNTVSKYGKYVTPINISGAIKPKLYNSKPDQLILPSMDVINSHLKRKNVTKTEIKYVPYPILTNVFNIVAQNISVISNGATYYGFGGINITLSPFDNVLKFAISKQNTDNTIVPFNIPSSNSIVQLIFKSSTSELRIPLYLESNEVDLSLGIVIFKIPTTNQQQLKTINQSNKKFYITITSNGVESVIYDGVFNMTEDTVVAPVAATAQTITPVTQPAVATSSVTQTTGKGKHEIVGKLTTNDTLKSLNQGKLGVKQLKRLQ